MDQDSRTDQESDRGGCGGMGGCPIGRCEYHAGYTCALRTQVSFHLSNNNSKRIFDDEVIDSMPTKYLVNLYPIVIREIEGRTIVY